MCLLDLKIIVVFFYKTTCKCLKLHATIKIELNKNDQKKISNRIDLGNYWSYTLQLAYSPSHPQTNVIGAK